MGGNLAVIAGYNDIKYYVQVTVESGKPLDLRTMVSIFIGGEANNFVKHYDTSCACRGKD